MLDFDDVTADMAGRGQREACGAAGGDRRHEAGELVVVEQHPASLELAPADALNLDCDGRAEWALVLGELDRHLDVERGLGQQPVSLLDHDVVLETEILGRDEARGDAARLVAPRGCNAITDRREFAAVIFGDGDLPASLHRPPDEIEFLLGGKCLAADGNVRARRTALRRDAELSHKAARRLRERHFGTELGGARCGERLGRELLTAH